MQSLKQGFVVNNVLIYGIVVVVANLAHARLLKLEIDFKNDVLQYMKCAGLYRFDSLLNAVVSKLE